MNEKFYEILNSVDDSKNDMKDINYKKIVENLLIIKQRYDKVVKNFNRVKEVLTCHICQENEDSDSDSDDDDEDYYSPPHKNFVRFRCGHYLCETHYIEELLNSEEKTRCKLCRYVYWIDPKLGSMVFLTQMAKGI